MESVLVLVTSHELSLGIAQVFLGDKEKKKTLKRHSNHMYYGEDSDLCSLENFHDKKLNKKKTICSPWPSGSVGWSLVQYTKRLQV